MENQKNGDMMPREEKKGRDSGRSEKDLEHKSDKSKEGSPEKDSDEMEPLEEEYD